MTKVSYSVWDLGHAWKVHYAASNDRHVGAPVEFEIPRETSRDLIEKIIQEKVQGSRAAVMAGTIEL